MASMDTVQKPFPKGGAEDVEASPAHPNGDAAVDVAEGEMDEKSDSASQTQPPGVARMEAAQAVWGSKGRWLIIGAVAAIMLMYEIDNTTLYIYNNYATSSFHALAELATLSTAVTIVFAVCKPPLAQLSNVIGRGWSYVLTISLYLLSYVLIASSTSLGAFAVGRVFHAVAQSGTNLLNDVTVSDVTTARWRSLALGLSFFPFLFTPWVAAYIVGSAVGPGGIGWRMGIGIYAIIMPFCASLMIGTLLFYERKAKKMGLARRTRMTVYDFCSRIDLGGIVLFSGGLALLLLPLTLAKGTAASWRQPHIVAMIVVGVVLLVALPFYEHYVARHPVVPPHYFVHRTIGLCLLLAVTDSLGFSCTHTYLYAWGSVARNFAVEVNTFYTYVNGVVQCLAAIVAGYIMLKTRRYKYLTLAGVVVRTVGYGVMLRLRGAENSTAELFVVQLIQGLGAGVLQVLVPAQVAVPHAELASVTALVISMSTVGGSIGACIAGGIYTNTFKPAIARRLVELGQPVSPELVDGIYRSITTTVPAWGTTERLAASLAYSDVMKYMTYAALGSSIPGIVIAVLIPDIKLPDRNNLVEG